MAQVPLCILIVDSDPLDRMMIQDALRQGAEKDYEFCEAENGEAAWSLYRQRKPDLLLLDPDLPDIRGTLLLRALRGEAELLPLPVVIVSHAPTGHKATEALAAGAQDVIAKSHLTPDSITRVVMNAQERFHLLQRAHASETLLRIASAWTSDCIYIQQVTTKELTIYEWSFGALEQITGFTIGEIEELGGWERLVYAADLSLVQQRNSTVFSGGAVNELQYRIVTKTGIVRWVAEQVQPMLDLNGKVVRIIGSIRNITARRQAEDALRALATTLEHQVLERTAELEQSNRELDRFAHIAAHDLKSPLRAIRHLAQWIKEDANDALPVTSQENLRKLECRIGRMERMLNDILLYSRLGRRDECIADVDVNELIEDIILLLAPPAGFQVIVADKLPVLSTARVPLELVFRNLISNAIKHHHQVEAGKLSIHVREQGNWVEFTVSDNGPGIDPRNHERIFELFQTLKPRDEIEGSGIGLSLIKKAVEQRGGYISVLSEVGQGTTFRFTWPLNEAATRRSLLN